MLTFRRKRQLKLAQRRVLIDSIKIGLASPMQIQKWAERELPNGKKIGRVTNPKTVDYKTLKPVKDGLFCERIFGPVKDFVCACGKRQGGGKGRFCTECEVEWTSCRTRRYRLGYIELASPVTHVWYIKGRPNYIATLLGEKQRLVEAVAYCTKFVLGEAALNDSGGIGRPSKTSEKSRPSSHISSQSEEMAEIVNEREGVEVSPEGAWETAHLPKQSQTQATVVERSGFASNKDINTASSIASNAEIPLTRSTNILPVLSFRTINVSSLPLFAAQRPSELLGLDNVLPGLTLAVPGETNVLTIVSASSIREYPNEFSKRVLISKPLCTKKRLSNLSLSFIQFQSVSDTKLLEKVSLPFRKDRGDRSLATFSKRPKRSRGTTYLYQSRNFASRDMVNGAREALKPKAWKGSQVVRDWRENQPYNGLASVRGETPTRLRGQGVYPNVTISDSYNTLHTAHSARSQTHFLPFVYPFLKQSPHNKPSGYSDIGVYSKKQTIPLSFAFAREPDERSQLLEFLYSPMTTGDFAIPVYNAPLMSDFLVSKTRSSQDTSRVLHTLHPQTTNQPWVNALGLTNVNSRIVSESWQIESFKDRQLFLLHTNLEASYSKTPTLGRKAVENPLLFPTPPRWSFTNGRVANEPPRNSNRRKYFTDSAPSSTPSEQSEEGLRDVKTTRDDGSWFALTPEGTDPIGSLSARNGEVANSGLNLTVQNQNKAKSSWDSGSLPLQARLIGRIRDSEALQMVRRGPLGPRFLLSNLEKRFNLRDPEPKRLLNAQVSPGFLLERAKLLRPRSLRGHRYHFQRKKW